MPFLAVKVLAAIASFTATCLATKTTGGVLLGTGPGILYCQCSSQPQCQETPPLPTPPPTFPVTVNCGPAASEGGWLRAAFINMTDASRNCPDELELITASSVRMCASSQNGGCQSVMFQTSRRYSKVCGRVKGYQIGWMEGFRRTVNIEGQYVHGLSVTRGSNPRKHIWTFAVGTSKDTYTNTWNCPCASYPGSAPQSFIGRSYFCESGDTGTYEYKKWYMDDPLFDSKGCLAGSTCCNRGGPWFSTTLSEATSDDLEVRWCTYRGIQYGNVGVEQLEIYVS